MKILHRSKRALPPASPACVAELINKLSNTPNEDLHEVLGQIDSWKWPRSDLNAWIKVLNKFDAILEEVIQDYNIDKLQVNVFTPMTKKTVSEILRFERLLLENSTNRKTYASYDRINSLLSTSDLDILILALNLLLRPAQQYSAQPAVSRALSISTHRLQSLGKRWSNLREYDVSLVDLVTDQGRPVLDALPIEAREVQFKFYNTGKAKRSKDRANEMEVDVPEISQPSQHSVAPVLTASSSQAAGAVTLYFDTQTLSSKEAMDILADCVDTYNVPEDERFELMCRIRAAQALLPGREEEREKLIIARLLATAIFVHTHPETQTASALFLYEPDLISHVAELLALDRNVPIGVQTAAVATLDAMARYRTKVQDVLAAVNAGVNHGTLMALLRKTVAEVATPESTLPHSFVEALLSFVIFLASHAAGGNMVVGAGLIPLLIQIIENRLSQRLAVVSKTMQLVDNVLYSFGNAFQLFCNNRGVEVLVDRIEYEVDEDINTLGPQEHASDIPRSYGQLPIVRTAALKHILRSMHRMMQSSGTAEGLRGLIDSSLLKSIKKIIEHRSLFGPNVLPIAINIMATFVHNEPTSLTVIQETGVPEAFYRAVEAGLEPVIEVIQAIPNAIGALCLNQAGQDQLTARPTIIPGLFSIFTSERHQRVLQDKENAVLIGSAVDELIRHHPSLKPAVFEAIKSTLSKIEDLGSTFTPSESTGSWYGLARASASTVQAPADDDILMRSSDTALIDEVASESTGRHNIPTVSPTDDVLDDNAPGRSRENIIVSYLDVICRFLEGLFQHTSHCKDFISNSEGLVLLGRLTALPCIPYDFGGSVASDSLVQVIRTMFDAAPNATMNALTSWVKVSLQETSTFWGSLSKKSKFIELLDLAGQSHAEANRTFRSLVTLLVRVILLSDIYATAGYAHGRSAGGLLQTLMGTGASEILPDLGLLHKACIWENVLMKASLPEKEAELEGNAILSSLQPPDGPSPRESGVAANGAHTSDTVATPTEVPGQEGPRESDPREENAKAFRHLANQIPGTLSPFFQSIVKLFSTRRNPDAAQKQQILESASSVADVLLKHLEPMESADDPTDSLSISSCYTSLLGLITTLMVDERTSQNTLHTVLFDSFYRKGGLDATVTICRSFMRTIVEHSQTKAEDRTDPMNQALGHAYGGIKVALHLLLSLISSKPIFESSQTILLLTRDKKDTDPDYFEPHNFLVRTRLAVLPIIGELWEAPWLVSSPQSLIKSVVQVVLEILNGEGEESPTDVSPHPPPPGASALSMGGPSLFRVTVPDENRIRQLTDMGFSRSGAERALIRTHNNVNAATELLLTNPFRFQNDPEPTPPQQQEPGGSGEATGDAPTTSAGTLPSGSASGQDDAATANSGDSPNLEADTRPPGKTTEEWRSELHSMREPLKSGVGRLALRLVDEHPELIFDVHNAFVGRTDGYQRSSVRLLVDDIQAFTASSQGNREQPLAVRCRLLALVLNEAPASFASIVMGDEQAFMEVVLILLRSITVTAGAKQPTIPKWLAALMLVAEALLSLSEDPRSITLPKEGEPIASQEVLTGPPYVEARLALFDFSLRLLALTSLPRDELLASLRLLVFMTRDHDLAMEFVKRDGVSLLFKSLKSSTGGVVGSQSYISIILRHIVEEPAVVRLIMREEVQRFLSHPRTRTVDATSYVRACNAMALRDPKAFVEVTKSLAQLERPFAYMSQIIPKDSDQQEGDPSLAEPGKDTRTHTAAQAEVTAHTLPSPPEHLEVVVHFLVGELMESVRPSPQQVEGVSNHEPTSPGTSAEGSLGHQAQPERKILNSNEAQDLKPGHYYSGFLMQSLTELMFSYDACKTAFLSYSPSKRSGTPSKDSAKARLVALHFALSDLVTFRTIEPDPSIDARNNVPLCNWAMSLIVALCVDTASSQPIKDVLPELVAVRKTVLEAVSRAIKDPSQSESLDARYGRLLALADLCYRLLTVRFNPGLRKPHEETPTHIAKIMLEKNFVSTLTNALAEVDLNYPNVRVVVAAILKPLELLSKIAIKMSRASDRTKGSEESKNEMDHESLSDEDDMEDGQDTAREETPDLYRNSSLGMFGGDMEERFAAEDVIDGDHGDEDEDVEMDFGEETGSEGTSATDEDEEEQEDPEDDEGDSEEEGWQDEDEDEDLLEEDEENHVPDADGQVDPDVDVDGVWEGVGIEDGGPDDGEEGDEEIAVPIYHHDNEEAEGDLESDEDRLEGELGFEPQDDGPSIGDVLGFNEAVSDGLPGFIEAHDGGFIISGGSRARRGRIEDDDMGIIGRNRGTIGSVDATTHPLLLEASGSSGRHIPDISRAGRRSQRILATGGHQDLLQAIEDIIGGGAVQLFQHIVNPRAGGTTDTIRLDVPPGTLVNLDRGLLPRRGGVSTSLRIDQSPRSVPLRPESRDFDPLPTMQRWSEEAKVLHGKFAPDRFAKLGNHVVLALLPAAVEKARISKETKEAAEREEAQRREAAAQTDEAANKAAEAVNPISTPAVTSPSPVETASGSGASAPPALTESDTEMLDATPESNSANEQDAIDDAGTTDTTTAQEGPGSGEPGPATRPERITVMVHGSPVDITDTGIDPTFLEALPDDMREEVVNQHIRDQQAARMERPPDSQISAEFLDALPPEIRAEILHQERIEQARRRAEERVVASSADPAPAPVEMDPASFIASLDPQLRQDVLMDQDEGFIQTLPSHIIAEAGAYRERVPRQPPRAGVGSRTQGVPAAAATRKPQTPRDAIQLLDKSGVAVLTLVNLCENSKTRAELFNFLLNILQEGTGDLAAIDRSFTQMTIRSSKGAAQTHRPAGKQKTGPEYLSSLPAHHSPSEVVPDLIAQRCLEALAYIVTSNELSSLFFLTEQEMAVGLRRHASKKGKGKEKQTAQLQYPIVLLLSLLDRQPLLKTPSVLELVVSLLDTVTRPLTGLKVQQKPEGSAVSIDPQVQPSGEAPPEPRAPLSEPNASAPHPPGALRSIVNILTVGDCGAKPFHNTLSLIQHLSFIPDARDVVAQELKIKAQEFGQSLYHDLDELANSLQGPGDDVFTSSVASKFSSPASDQAKLLRVLKTIDYMFSPKASTSPEPQPTADMEKIQGIYESFRFTPLWRRLGDCLSIIEQRSEIEHIATVLLPLIEALMVVCKYVGPSFIPGGSSRVLRASASPRSPTTPRETMEDLFVSFTDAHRKVLNVMVRNNPSLMSGSFSLLVNNPRVLDFDNKRNYFNQQLHKRPHSREHHGTLQLNVRRQRVFEDSFQSLQRKTGEQIKYGKLSTDVDPNNALFQPCAADRLTYQPNKASWVNPEHLSFFKFVGRVIGKAIYDGRLLDAYFARSMYRQILGKPVDYRDVEWIDPEYYNSLCWILENDPSPLDLTFSVEGDEFGVTKIVPMKENGESIPVTLDNKREFVQLSAQYRLYVSIKDQLEHLLSGFYEIIPKDLIAIELLQFNEKELELLISGTPDIDVDEWRSATEYNGYSSSDPVIVWWWRALKSFNRDERAKVLSFATGTSRVPLGGFNDLQGVQGTQRFSIHRAYGDPDRLPQAHTCFNQIDLPQYSSYEMLRQQLLLAINEGGEGFGFA
ncbi:hypothetical protein B0F90DRAFT_1815046 [Multifurca ochricompacta]|uniref:HECT-type E3 ubiquitin transferase n=1 Tax=Multifurca ochricompacta TaxID=376703 RepID=A0AAD4M8U1_9AGAM|nr:hypothetical protein B0F90DRAFT_1815046 [Multifurca ochricompacta]